MFKILFCWGIHTVSVTCPSGMLGLQQGAESVHHHQPVPSMQPTGGQFSEMFLCSTPIAE